MKFIGKHSVYTAIHCHNDHTTQKNMFTGALEELFEISVLKKLSPG